MGEAIDNNGTAGHESQAPQSKAADAPADATELDALRAELARAEESLSQTREQHLRAAAELDNVRKRAQRDIENAHRYALERFVGELLPVRDSLELGVRSAAQGDRQSLLEGQEATLKLLEKVFEKFAIKQIDPNGQRFDPSLHEAVMMQATPNAEPNTVLQVVQSGYELNGRLLRPARVIVATAPTA